MSSPILVGREAETRAFEVALQDARDGHPAVIVLGGEAGVGKTRLIAEFAARTRELGGTAVVGAATPSGGPTRTPFAALTPVLRGLIRSMDARLIDRMLGDARRDLAALLPELGPAGRVADEPEAFAAARLSESVLVALEAAVRLRPPLLVAFDDMHWADDATRDIVTYVSRNLEHAGVVTLVTYRTDAVHRDERTIAFIIELTRVAGAERIELEPLSADDVSRQVRAILGADPATEIMRALVRRSSGNPFFVEELVASVVHGGGERPPPSVRTMVEARMARITPGARALVEAAALCGSDVPVHLLAIASGMPPGAFDDAVREAIDADLLVPWGVGPQASASGDTAAIDRIDVRHVLVREVIQAGLSAPRSREHHLALAAAIEARPALSGASELERASRLSSHLLLAGEVRRAIPAILRTAAAADDARAFATADEAYSRVLASWHALGPEATSHPTDRARVLERAARAASLIGDPRRAVALAEEAVHDVQDPPTGAVDADQALRILLHLGTYLAEAGDHARAVLTLRETADAATDGSLLRARCLTALARELVILRDHEEAARLARQAAALADRAGARREAMTARSVEALALVRLGRVDDALGVVQAASKTSEQGRRSRPTVSRPSRYAAELQAYLDRATVLERSGDASAAARAALDGQEAAASRGLSGTLGPLMRAVAARSLLRTGAWDEAAVLAAPVEGADPRSEAARATALVRALLATWRGGWEAAEHDLETARSLPDASDLPGWASFEHLVEAESAAARRRYADARTALQRGIVASEAEDDHLGAARLATLGIRVEADAAEAAGGRRSVRDLSSAIEVATGYLVRLRAGTLSAIRREPSAIAEALVATGEGDMARLTGASDAAGRWELGVDAWGRAGDPFMEALARTRLAEVLVGDSTSRAAAAEPLRAALRIADRLGALPLARTIEALARRARLRGIVVEQPTAPGQDPPGYGAARRLGLSEREIEVLALVASGLSDREIGERLFITTKTVGHHVSHILDKLVVDRRGEAAAVAFRIGLAGDPG